MPIVAVATGMADGSIDDNRAATSQTQCDGRVDSRLVVRHYRAPDCIHISATQPARRRLRFLATGRNFVMREDLDSILTGTKQARQRHSLYSTPS